MRCRASAEEAGVVSSAEAQIKGDNITTMSDCGDVLHLGTALHAYVQAPDIGMSAN